MTPEAQRIAIAEACGLSVEPKTLCLYCKGNTPYEAGDDYGITLWEECNHCNNTGKVDPYDPYVPDYPNDLNAMHEAEKVLTQGTAEKIIHVTNAYTSNLARILQCFDTALFQFAHATAAQRAEALLRTLNLWTDQQ